MNKPQIDLVAKCFAALGDPVRLHLVQLLSERGEICSCELEGPLNKSQPTISHHTKVLAESGLIVGEKRGKWMWWKLNGQTFDIIRGTLGKL